MAIESEALNAFAQTVSHLLTMRSVVGRAAARSYDELLALACRKVDEVAPLNVSAKAQESATKLGLGDLRSYCWFCPLTSKHRDAETGKRLFLWEHYRSVADIQTAIRSLGPHATHEQIAEILGTTKIVWVLRKEGDALGNRSRPDPEKAYRDARVSLLHPWEACRPVDCRRHRNR